MSKNIDNLDGRVTAFRCFALPGQPMAAHMGTTYLVNDLWNEVIRQQEEIASLTAEIDNIKQVEFPKRLVNVTKPLIKARDAALAAASTSLDEAVNRFLSWGLPRHFYPDCYISFDREKASQSPHGWPTGTNLLTAEQARKMLEYVMAPTPCQVEFHTESDTHENTTSTR